MITVRDGYFIALTNFSKTKRAYRNYLIFFNKWILKNSDFLLIEPYKKFFLVFLVIEIFEFFLIFLLFFFIYYIVFYIFLKYFVSFFYHGFKILNSYLLDICAILFFKVLLIIDETWLKRVERWFLKCRSLEGTH